MLTLLCFAFDTPRSPNNQQHIGQSELDVKDDGPSVIVHSSNPNNITPLTDAIVGLGKGNDLLLTPNEPLPPAIGEKTSYPIYITLPPYELREFIQQLDEEWKARAEDFVFFSGGKICGVVEPTLREFGMCRDAMTQVTVGFSLPKPGTGLGGTTRKPEDMSCNIGADANGENKWAGESVACGKWNGAIAGRLSENAIRCKTVFYREWRRAMVSVIANAFVRVVALRCICPVLTLSGYTLFHKTRCTKYHIQQLQH